MYLADAYQEGVENSALSKQEGESGARIERESRPDSFLFFKPGARIHFSYFSRAACAVWVFECNKNYMRRALSSAELFVFDSGIEGSGPSSCCCWPKVYINVSHVTALSNFYCQARLEACRRRGWKSANWSTGCTTYAALCARGNKKTFRSLGLMRFWGKGGECTRRYSFRQWLLFECCVCRLHQGFVCGCFVSVNKRKSWSSLC